MNGVRLLVCNSSDDKDEDVGDPPLVGRTQTGEQVAP